MSDRPDRETFDGFFTKYVGDVIERKFQRYVDENFASTCDAGPHFYGTLGGDIWRTRAEAEEDARRRVHRKIASLERQIAKLKSGPYGSEEKGRG